MPIAKPSLLRTLLFPLVIATLRSASLHAADAPDAQSVFDGDYRQPFARSFLEKTSSRKGWREWIDELDQRPFTAVAGVRSQADAWLPAGWPLPPERWPDYSAYSRVQVSLAPAASFTAPQPFVLAAVTPQPQAAGQSLSIGPNEQNGGNYTVSSAGETWNIVYLGNSGVGTLNHSAGTLTITTELDMAIGGYSPGGSPPTAPTTWAARASSPAR